MNDLAVNTLDAEYVDRLIDQVIADPERVDDVKKLLRYKMATPDGPNLVQKHGAPAPSLVDDDDLEDLWDNVPI